MNVTNILSLANAIEQEAFGFETSLSGIGRRLIGGFRTRSSTAGRSKYMPHIGKKERARHAGKPDGAMHCKPGV